MVEDLRGGSDKRHQWWQSHCTVLALAQAIISLLLLCHATGMLPVVSLFLMRCAVGRCGCSGNVHARGHAIVCW